MAPIMAVIGIGGNQERRKKVLPENDTAALEMKKRNEELEKELKESKVREEEMKRKLHSAWERLRVAEEAEERLCSQLGDLEAEAVHQAREYHSQIVYLTEQLSRAQTLVHKSDSSISIPSS
ncbi:hypothetical protein TanjilG_00479 [Lupinus angustifolius]|uniref:Uncharacterized protein n=1 Tax=Lupinus angustifolius TaxID=3871 RepID=A0A4P1QXN4_LUPAN|nr:PREDICTED: protein RESPONSE TO LOW SULFUR 2-like [Lupinus angustifolius]OIV96897.1 hypothetical protein TanjilG_00479 [Lupinus angustifolius]